MAELAAGAVNSLLGLIRNEALLLSRVRGDVRFIKDEMESMKSFLAHLARTMPPGGGGHDEQVLTWMKQVEELADDCRGCVIILYLHRGDPEVHRAMGGIQRYVRWFPWFVRKMIDQHRAASRLVELKERARDVSERRKRYDVKVPTKPSSSQAAGRVAAVGALGYEEDDSDNEAPMVTADDDRRRRLLEPSSPVDYFTQKLLTWWYHAAEMKRSFASISIVVPQNDFNVACETVLQALEAHFHRPLLGINLADVHHRYSTGSPLDILSCILHGYMGKGTSLDEILRKVEESKVGDKIQHITACIETFAEDMILADEKKNTEESKWMAPVAGIATDEPLGVLDQVLSGIHCCERGRGRINPTRVAQMLKSYLEQCQYIEDEAPICLHISQYEYVLKKVFPDPDHSSQEKQRSLQVHQGNLPATLGQDNINGLIHSHKIALEIIQEVVARPHVPGPGSNDSAAVKEKAISSDSASPITSASKTAIIRITNKAIAAAKEAKDKMDDITSLLKEQMMIKGLLDKIDRQLKYEPTLIVLQDEMDYISRWKETINALSILPGTSHGSNAVIVITTNNQKAQDYCCPQGEPITFSLVDLYNDIVLQLTRQRKTEGDKDNLKIFHDILEKCNPDEFCMKMFAHALYANPNRSYSELLRLHEALDLSKGSLGATSNFKKMFKFSYNDLPKDYKSCLLYLAIFPQGYVIKRSTIVGRWVTDGLIDKEDWCTSVDHADACFSTLINRWFICAVDIGATGKVKSCVVGDQVYGIISKIAKKEHILDTRLSYHLAHHFSIFSGLQLSRSDSIQSFLHKLPEYSPQLPLVKVLHLEGCHFLEGNHSYLKDICNKMLLLKCLSLRGTNVTHLPREINNLHDLEILDIQKTSVPVKETRHVLLLKLRRLLAGDTNSSASSNGTGISNRKQKSLYSCVSIPYKIEKMENLEVLSNVMASSHGNDLKDISKLWQLRKLGVVINDNDKHLFNLLQAIGDLKECLQSISITIAETRTEGTSTEPRLLTDSIYSRLVKPPKLLESVSINGRTNRVHILSLLGKGSNELAKVVLSGTMLEQRNLKVLDSLPKLRCIKLRHFAYNEPQLIFKKEEFEHLKCLLIDGPNMTDINFVEGAAVALEKIVLSSTNIKYLYGVGHLPKLKVLELKGNELFDSFSDGEEAAQKTEDRAAPQKNTQLVSIPEDGGVPQNQTQVASPTDDGAVSQKNTESVQLPEDRATSKKKTELASPSDEVGEAPQKSTGLVSQSEDGAASQKNTERNIIFKKEEFQHLKYFHFEDTRMVNIIFEDGAAPELEKIFLSMANKKCKLIVSCSLPKLREIQVLPKLREIRVRGDKSIFLSLFENADKINKVILHDTLLNKGDDLYKVLSKKPSMRCLELLDDSYDESQLTFDQEEFGNLNLIIIKCSKIQNINFHSRSCPNLEKIIWFYNDCGHKNEIQISGIDNIGKLKQVDLNGNYVPRQLRKDIKAHKNKPVLTYDKPQQEDKARGNEQGDAPCFPRFTTSYFSKKKDQH